MTSMESIARTKPCRIVILDKGYGSYEPERQVVEAAGYTLEVFQGEYLDRNGRIEFTRGSEGIIVRWSIIDGAFMDALPGLKAIVRCGVGYENVDVAAATARGIRVANVQGYANHCASDHALALIFACARGLCLGQRLFKETFGHAPRLDMTELRHATLGIVGLGQIGGTLAQKAQTLFRRVLASDPYIPEERFAAMGAFRADLDALLEESHVISLHCSLTPETTHLINRAAFHKMKQRPILVNTARGLVVDESALLDALNEDRIHSAGLDVFSKEPPTPALDALLAHPRVIATGHYAFYSETAMRELQRRAAENLVALLRGETPHDCLNPEVALGASKCAARM